MATIKQIQFKRSKVAGVRPTAAVLAEGELAINLKDRLLFTKDDLGNIIDLGFAKGGQVDGNIVHNGNYTQTGDYTLTGNFTMSGAQTGAGSIDLAGNIKGADITSKSGNVFVDAPSSAAASHVWFRETGSTKSDKAVIFTEPQSTTSGTLKIRVQNGTAAAQDRYTFTFWGDGRLQAANLEAALEVRSNSMRTNTISFDGKPSHTYDYTSLTNQSYPGTGDTNGVNYLWKARAHSGSSIFHALMDQRNGSSTELGYYSGAGPETKMFSIRTGGTGSEGGGEISITRSLAVSVGSDNVGYSALGIKSIALGDNDTGFKWNSDGVYSFYANALPVGAVTTSGLKSFRILDAMYSGSATGTPSSPSTANFPLLRVWTGTDGNAQGDGHTYLGYWNGTSYDHHFRGKGITYINTLGGLSVTANIYSSNIYMRDNAIVNVSSDSAGRGAWNGQLSSTAPLYHDASARVDADNYFPLTKQKFKGGVWSDGINIKSAGLTADRVVHFTNSTTDGGKRFKFRQDGFFVTEHGGFVAQTNDGLRIINSTGTRGVVLHNNGSDAYFLITDSGNANGAWNSLRPLRIYLDTGSVRIGNGLQVDGGIASYSDITMSAGQIRLTSGGGIIAQDGNVFFNKAGYGSYMDVLCHMSRPNISNDVAWNAAPGDYQVASGGSSALITQFKSGTAGSTPSFQLKAMYKNGGLAYRSSRDSYGFETTWANIYTDQNKPSAADVGAYSKAQVDNLFSGGRSNIGIGAASALGANSLVLGDSDTGLKQNGDGILDVYANNAPIMRFTGSQVLAHRWLQVNASDGACSINGPASNSAIYFRGGRAGTWMYRIGYTSTNTDLYIINDATGTSQRIGSNEILFNKMVQAPEFYLTSDRSFKTDIVDIESQSSKLHEVKVRRYALKDGSNDNAIGVIAQEFEEQYPELVKENSDGLKTVNYRAMSTVLWKITQEKDQELQETKAKVEDLESRLARLEALLSK